MNTLDPARTHRRSSTIALLAVLSLAAGCSALVPKAVPQPSFYMLQSAAAETAQPIAAAGSRAGPALVVETPHAAAGLDSAHLLYVREAHRLEYFAHSQWVDTPARMLAPLIVAALDRQPGFAAVVSAPSLAAGDLRLETEILDLRQEFGAGPSRIHFVLRANLVDAVTYRVLAEREFERLEPAASDDARGGVATANRVVQAALDDLARWCSEVARGWQPAAVERRGR